MNKYFFILTGLTLVTLQPHALAAGASAKSDALLFVANNLGRGAGNFYIYQRFSDKQVQISKGDILAYDVFLHPSNPVPLGGIDVDFDGVSARDKGIVDQNGLLSHGGSKLTPAIGKWYHREFVLDEFAGHTTKSFNLQFEGDLPGRYVQFIANVIIKHSGGAEDVIYQGGPPPSPNMQLKEGYSKYPVLSAVDKSEMVGPDNLDTLLSRVGVNEARERNLSDVESAIQLAAVLAGLPGGNGYEKHITDAKDALASLSMQGTMSTALFEGTLNRAQEALSQVHPLMRQYTGHIVGHGHIDFQWLWLWPETVIACRDTFRQACKFMEQFPDFTYSQSSTALYAAVEKEYPALFQKIQRHVKQGRWELLGGRITEADSNIISPESHARQFLYGQRYFRERFGKTSEVAWEPDTFGHNWQMPQIARLGGCKYYYFSRAGNQHPLFWWESPGGSRLLTFDETALPGGGAYSGNLSSSDWQQMADFAKTTGSKDMLWVYGVGNHGGGPTLEDIQTAKQWMKNKALPNARFSTVQQFFKGAEKYDLTKLPVVRDELNTVFEGCYTSHSDVKRWNRDAEAITESAEAASATAMQLGFRYPSKEFRKNWEDICANQHHDTIGGTSVHGSYARSRVMYSRVIHSSRAIGQAAVDFMAKSANGKKDCVLVFNPLVYQRTGEVKVKVAGAQPGAIYTLTGAGGRISTGRVDDEGMLRFVAEDVPSLGYRTYHLGRATYAKSLVQVSDDGTRLSNDLLDVEIDPSRGVISRVYDRKNGREILKPGGTIRQEIHWEKMQHWSAWTIGNIERVEPLTGPVNIKIVARGPEYAAVEFRRNFRNSTIIQRVGLYTGVPYVDFHMEVDWQEKGSQENQCPFLKAAFDINAENPKAAYEIPFGTIERPVDNKEYPALKWAALFSPKGGASVLNDCKHGYSADGTTLRLSLLRCSHWPDPIADVGPHVINFAMYPNPDGWTYTDSTRTAYAYNHPLMASTSPGTGKAGRERSFLSVDKPDVLVTGVKRAEDSDGLVVRCYDSSGKGVKAVLRSDVKVKSARVVNLIEDDLGAAQASAERVKMELSPWEIKTLLLNPAE